MASLGLQEFVTFAAVGVAMLFLALRFFRAYLAEPVARFLLGRKQVRAAMWMNRQVRKGCADCAGCGPSVSHPKPPDRPER